MNIQADYDAAPRGGRLTHYTKLAILAAVSLSLLLMSAALVFAAEPQTNDDSQELEKIIEVQKLSADHGREMTTAGAQSTPEPADPEAAAGDEQEWPGSFRLFGSKTRFAIGGFAQFDMIYDTDAIAARCEFVTSSIATDRGTPAGGADGQTSFCVNATRLTFESRTPTKLGRLKTFVSLDLFGDLNTPSLRMRQAYGELSGALWGGDLLMGQAWGTFVDLEAWPDILDFEGPNSAIAVRQPMIRWTKQVSAGIEAQLAAEAPGGEINGADPLTRWPDAVGSTKWTHGHGYLKGAGILRDLRAVDENNPAETALGWGLSASGSVAVPAVTGKKDSAVFEASYGEGTGGYYGDFPPNAVYDPESASLEPLRVFAFYVGYNHSWSDSLSSGFLYARLEVDNLDSQPADAFRDSAYFSLNLIWRPDTPLLFGVEFLRGGRRDKDGSEGTDNRIQFTSQFSF